MVNVQSFSAVGGHLLNEDAFVAQQHPLAADVWLCFVADGQGGRAGGGPAARLACQTAWEAAISLTPERLSSPAAWSGILQLADRAVDADTEAGFTTFVGFCVQQGRVVGVSSGDSAALLLCGAPPVHKQAVELTARQHKNPPVGSSAAVATTFCSPLTAPWQLLAMTDGVWKYVGWETIIETAHREQGAALITDLQRLARLPNTGEFQDDFTLVLLEQGE